MKNFKYLLLCLIIALAGACVAPPAAAPLAILVAMTLLPLAKRVVTMLPLKKVVMMLQRVAKH